MCLLAFPLTSRLPTALGCGPGPPSSSLSYMSSFSLASQALNPVCYSLTDMVTRVLASYFISQLKPPSMNSSNFLHYNLSPFSKQHSDSLIMFTSSSLRRIAYFSSYLRNIPLSLHLVSYSFPSKILIQKFYHVWLQPLTF